MSIPEGPFKRIYDAPPYEADTDITITHCHSSRDAIKAKIDSLNVNETLSLMEKVQLDIEVFKIKRKLYLKDHHRFLMSINATNVGIADDKITLKLLKLRLKELYEDEELKVFRSHTGV